MVFDPGRVPDIAKDYGQWHSLMGTPYPLISSNKERCVPTFFTTYNTRPLSFLD